MYINFLVEILKKISLLAIKNIQLLKSEVIFNPLLTTYGY
jgi:hypothetical protein